MLLLGVLFGVVLVLLGVVVVGKLKRAVRRSRLSWSRRCPRWKPHPSAQRPRSPPILPSRQTGSL